MTIDHSTLREYHKERRAGCSASEALRRARTTVRFADLHFRGLVRLHAEPDCDMYDDSYIDTWPRFSKEAVAREKKALWYLIEREGVWTYFGQWRASEDDDFESVDSIGGIIGSDLDDYRYDLMQSAIDALDAHWAEEAAELSERATYAAGGELPL